MLKIIVAAVLAAGLIAAPLPIATTGAAAQTAKSNTPTKPKTAKPLTAGQKAAQARQKKCGAEWKTAKAAGKIEKGMKWPQYWSACNKRLKAAGG